MITTLEKFALFLHKKYGITPDILTYIRIFAAPWLALLISQVILKESFKLAIITIILYALTVTTYFLEKILVEKLPGKGEKHGHSKVKILSRLSDKILIIILLIPFGFNLFTFLIILAESMLLYKAIRSGDEEKEAERSGKIKMILQMFLIPILILQAVTSFIPEMFVYIYIIVTIIYTCIFAYSRYFYFKKE